MRKAGAGIERERERERERENERERQADSLDSLDRERQRDRLGKFEAIGRTFLSLYEAYGDCIAQFEKCSSLQRY